MTLFWNFFIEEFYTVASSVNWWAPPQATTTWLSSTTSSEIVWLFQCAGHVRGVMFGEQLGEWFFYDPFYFWRWLSAYCVLQHFVRFSLTVFGAFRPIYERGDSDRQNTAYSYDDHLPSLIGLSNFDFGPYRSVRIIFGNRNSCCMDSNVAIAGIGGAIHGC